MPVVDARPTPPPLRKLPNLSPMDESALATNVRDLFLRARRERRELAAKWVKNWNVLHKPLWGNRARHLPRPNVNEALATIDTLVAWMTDQEPTIDITPAVPPLNPWYATCDELCQDLKTTLRSSWQVNATSAEIEKLAYDGLTYGIGFLKSTWDGSAYRGHGDAVITRVDPFSIYVDPDATSMETMNYIIEARTISMQELERRFPGASQRINGAWEEDVDAAPSTLNPQAVGGSIRANPALMRPALQPIAPATTASWVLSDRMDATDEPGVTILEAWLRTPMTVNGLTYDSWRCVVMAANRILMDKGAEELWSHGQHPYQRYVPVETGEFYGHALVTDLAPMQASINRALASIEQNLWLSGNPVFKEDTRAGISRTAIVNEPGQRITINPGADVGWLPPPPIQAQLGMELVRFYLSEMERISGLSAVVRGASPSGRNAQGVIDSVQEAAFVRIRKALRNLSRTIGSAGEKAASMVVEFYNEPRMVTTVDIGGGTSAIQLRAQHFYLPGPDGRSPLRFQMLFDAGESASTSRGMRIAEADQLYALGAIDDVALLEIHSFPRWQDVAKRVQAAKVAAGTIGQPPTQRAAARR